MRRCVSVIICFLWLRGGDGSKQGLSIDTTNSVLLNLKTKQINKSSDHSLTKSLVFTFFCLRHHLASPPTLKTTFVFCDSGLSYFLIGVFVFLIHMKALILQIVISPSKNLPTFLLSNSMVGSGDFQICILRFNPYPGPGCFRLVPSCKHTNRHKMFLLLCPELFPFAQAAAKLVLSSGGYHGNWQPCWLFPTPPFFFVRG